MKYAAGLFATLLLFLWLFAPNIGGGMNNAEKYLTRKGWETRRKYKEINEERRKRGIKGETLKMP